MVSNTKEVASELLPVLKVYKDGTVDRLLGSPFVPPSSPTTTTTTTTIISKDTTISSAVSARLYLPPTTTTTTRLPILVYFHGGGFCIESAFSSFCHRYITSLVSHSPILAVSIEYRLAPENPLPIAYEDSWSALQWVASHSIKPKSKPKPNSDPWLSNYGDFSRIYIGGDSAGANIAHNILMRAGVEPLHGGVEILGAFLSHPYFWGSDPIGSESKADREMGLLHRTWMFAYPGAPGGVDNPMINPFASNAPSLKELKCARILVVVAEMDELRERGVRYGEEVRESGWGGDLEVVEVEAEDHCFHILNPETKNAKNLIKVLASFLK
ncbi:hypothetical protein CsSME_00020952 [Camellia sinensis var. sinensis]